MDKEKVIKEIVKVMCYHCKERSGEVDCPRLTYFKYNKDCFKDRLAEAEMIYKKVFRIIKEEKRYLTCKYLDAGMDGMLCSKSLCSTCKEFNGEKCKDYIRNCKKN